MNRIEDRVIAGIEERIRAAASDRRPLCIRGGGTKDFYGETPAGEPLDVRELCGIVSYAPAELVVTAKGGTPLVDIEQALAAHDQMLAFEPPHFSHGSTLGGVVASGLSGPRRPYAGSVRDFVLGTRVVDGTGTSIAFGGQVIKNVAGFDVSRLMTGALGTLGVLAEVSLKCLPKPKVEATRALACDAATALRLMNEWGGKPLPISATAHHDGVLRVRLSGTAAGVANAEATIGGEAIDGDAYWTALRDQTLDYFRPAIDGGAQLWRLSVRSTGPACDVPGDAMIEWGGALRWLVCAPIANAARIRDWTSANGGHATLFRASDKSPGAFQPLPAPLAELHARLAQIFDPHGILNPGRMYACAR
jgi:glycolate oxidase FAD binding subunit